MIHQMEADIDVSTTEARRDGLSRFRDHARYFGMPREVIEYVLDSVKGQRRSLNLDVMWETDDEGDVMRMWLPGAEDEYEFDGGVEDDD